MEPAREALTQVTGRVAVLDRADVDTDQIIPKQFLKRIERSGYGEFLFFDWMKDPAFELRRPEYDGAPILVAGRNFGCGSSREHAAWALEDYGFRVVLAPSFADIFRTNAIKSGLAPIELAEDELAQIKAAVAAENELTVDLEALEISHPIGPADRVRVRPVRAAHARERPRRRRADAAARGPDRRVRGGAPRRGSTPERCVASETPLGAAARRRLGRAASRRPRRRRRPRGAPATRAPRPGGDLAELAARPTGRRGACPRDDDRGRCARVLARRRSGRRRSRRGGRGP